MDVAVGKFYRFKPRNAWPPSLQQSIPEDKLYFIHPVMVIAVPPPGSAGTVEVVHTTSSPNLISNLHNYLSISHNTPLSGDGNPNMPLCVNAKLPKDSWAVLDSRRRFSVTILEPWIERGIHFRLGKQSRKRLVLKVNDRMKALALPQRPQPQSAPSQVQVGMAPVRVVATTSPATEKSLDIQDIKKSLAGLKVAVSALEGLCKYWKPRRKRQEKSQQLLRKGVLNLRSQIGTSMSRDQMHPRVQQPIWWQMHAVELSRNYQARYRDSRSGRARSSGRKTSGERDRLQHHLQEIVIMTKE